MLEKISKESYIYLEKGLIYMGKIEKAGYEKRGKIFVLSVYMPNYNTIELAKLCIKNDDAAPPLIAELEDDKIYTPEEALIKSESIINKTNKILL